MKDITPARQVERQRAREYALLIAVAVCVVILDQTTKAVVTSALNNGRTIELLGGILRLDYTSNTGAAFGFFRAGDALFAVVAVLVSAAIVATYGRLGEEGSAPRVGLGLVLGGALGNLSDRLRLGHVVDFVDLGWWPVFNMADSAVVIGVLVLIYSTLGHAADSTSA